jgi:hypothetical protein
MNRPPPQPISRLPPQPISRLPPQPISRLPPQPLILPTPENEPRIVEPRFVERYKQCKIPGSPSGFVQTDIGIIGQTEPIDPEAGIFPYDTQYVPQSLVTYN